MKLANAEDFFIVLVGNKADLTSQREITYEEGFTKSKEIGASIYYETSAADDNSIQNLF